jgi:1-acyl-sn-glycerol-3-phosphate acyltransferase
MALDDLKRPAIKHLYTSSRTLAKLPRKAMAKSQFPVRSAPTPRGVEQMPSKLRGNYDTAWARRYPARLVRKVALETVGRGIAKYYADPEIFNEDRLVGLNGPAIFASNHHSHADTLMMKMALPNPWRHKVFIAAAGDYFFDNQPSAVLSALFIGAIPIERESISRKTIEQPIKLLREGWSMVIFPEGGRGTDGWGRDFKAGVGFLSKQANVPVVPVHLEGTRSILPKGRNWPTRSRVTVNFGAPMWFGDSDNNRGFTERLEHEVAVLADEDTTDWWAARVNSHAGTTPSLHGPDISAWRRRWARGDRRRSTTARSDTRWPYI